MALHLLKMAVGAGDFDDLRRLQKLRRKERGISCFFTRNMPRRSEELLDEGSIYWVIKGYVRARQRLVDFTAVTGAEGERYCRVKYDPKIVPTILQPRRAFQGWRYLEAKDAPADRPSGSDDAELEMPATMLRELRALGLL
jgi:hypothetical protein